MTRITALIRTCADTLRASGECRVALFRGLLKRVILPETHWQAVRRELLQALRSETSDARRKLHDSDEKRPDLLRKRHALTEVALACGACPRRNQLRLRQGLPPFCALQVPGPPRLTDSGDIQT